MFAVRLCYIITFGKIAPMNRDIPAARVTSARLFIVSRLPFARTVRREDDSVETIRSRA
jgi:hypothetical protein